MRTVPPRRSTQAQLAERRPGPSVVDDVDLADVVDDVDDVGVVDVVDIVDDVGVVDTEPLYNGVDGSWVNKLINGGLGDDNLDENDDDDDNGDISYIRKSQM